MASTSLGGFLLCCTRCGSYAWKRARAIAAPCPCAESRPGLAIQKRKLASGLFPGLKDGTIGVLVVPNSCMVQWLLGRMQGHEQSGEGFFDPEAEGPIGALSRDQVLAAYGLSAQGWLDWAQLAHDISRKSEDVPVDSEGEDQDSDSSPF